MYFGGNFFSGNFRIGYATSGPAADIIELIDTVEGMNLQQGLDNSLDAKLDAAMNALDDVNQNNDVAAINSLQSFINAVEAQRGNKITSEQADELIAAAEEIIASLSGSSGAPGRQRTLSPIGKTTTLWGNIKVT